MKSIAEALYIDLTEYSLLLRKSENSILVSISRRSPLFEGVCVHYERSERGRKAWYKVESLAKKQQARLWGLVREGLIKAEGAEESGLELGGFEKEEEVPLLHLEEIEESRIFGFGREGEMKASALARLCGQMSLCLEAVGVSGRLCYNKEMKSRWERLSPSLQSAWQRKELYGKPISNLRNWVRRVNEYAESGWRSLVHGLTGKADNAAKHWEWAKDELLRLYCNADLSGKSHNKLMIAQVYRLWCKRYAAALQDLPLRPVPGRTYTGLYSRLNYINQATGEYVELPEPGEAPVSFSTVYEFLSREDIQEQTARMRHGNKYFSDMHQIKTLAGRPEFYGHLWSLDDYNPNFYITNEKGIRSHKRAKTVLVWETQKDSQAVLLGFAVGYEMSADLVWGALLDAAVFCGGLAAEVETDNWNRWSKTREGRKETEFALALRKLFAFGASFRKKAHGKLAESFNNIAQETYFRTLPGYLGANIQAKRQDNKRNEDNEVFNVLKDKYPTYSLADIREMLNTYRLQSAGTSEAYRLKTAAKRGAHFEALEGLSLSRLLPLMERTRVRVRAKALRLEFDKKEYYYEASELINDKPYRVAFLPSRTSSGLPLASGTLNDKVLAIDEEENTLHALPLMKRAQRAKAEQGDEDRQLLAYWEEQKVAQMSDLRRFERRLQSGSGSFVAEREAREEQQAAMIDSSDLPPRFDTSYIDPDNAYGVSRVLGTEAKNVPDAEEHKGLDLGNRLDY